MTNSDSEKPLTKRAIVLVVVAAFLACAAKLYCAWTTIGSNDVTTFYNFSKVIEKGGLVAAYHLGPMFNHPPLVGDYLYGIRWLSQHSSFSFPFLLRLPSILADLAVVLVLLWWTLKRKRLWLSPAVWLVFALSPVAFMISGYHGNTDPVLVLFLVLAALMCAENRPAAAAIFFALSLHVKVAGLIVAPVFFFFWLARGQAWRFSLTCAAVLVIGWIEPLLACPLLFFKNVLSYSSFWGFWGITYWLELTNLAPVSGHPIFEPSGVEQVVVALLKSIIIGSIIVLAWRRRGLSGEQIFSTLALAWAIFFAFAPGTGPQYLVWAAPFLLFCSARWYLVVTGASALYQFFFYNTISHGMPWFYGTTDRVPAGLIEPWALWPWLALSAGLFWMWKRGGSPKIWSLQTVRSEIND